MKKVLLALGFTAIATSAQAAMVGNLSLNTYGSTTFVGTNDVINTSTGTFGQLSATANTTLKFTYLGNEAQHNNSLILNGLAVPGSATNTVSINDSFLLNTGPGVVDFGFKDGITALNTTNPQFNIVYLENVDSLTDEAGNPFAFLVGYNDEDSIDADFDDYVVGINEVTVVPVPAALPLMASALCAFSIAHRRNKAKATK